MNKQNFKNGLNKYPVSTDALDFMQEQIKFVATLTEALGTNVIIKQSSSNEPGLIVVNGELLPLQGAPQGYITIQEESQSITAKGETFLNARIIRKAQYTSNSLGSTSFKSSDFTVIDNVVKLKEDLIRNELHHVPKGTIIDYYSENMYDVNPNEIYGWIPCTCIKIPDGNSGFSEDRDCAKWKAVYGENITFSAHGQYCFRITQCMGVEIPDLSGRFIVGADAGSPKFENKTKDGAIQRTLKEENLPAHTHELEGLATQGGNLGSAGHYGTWVKHTGVAEDRTGGTISEGSSKPAPFDILPPYIALYKLIKVI